MKGIGISAAIFAGGVGSILSQILLIDAKEVGINPFLIIGVVFLLMTVVYEWMPETYQMEPQDQVEEMKGP